MLTDKLNNKINPEVACTELLQCIGNERLVIVRGLPGSGKTTIVESIFSDEETIIVDPDKVNPADLDLFALTPDNLGLSQKTLMYRWLRGGALEAMSDGKRVVWNQPWSEPDGLTKTINFFLEMGFEESDILVIEVNVPPEIAKERVVSRIQGGGHGPTEQKMAAFIDKFQYGYVHPTRNVRVASVNNY